MATPLRAPTTTHPRTERQPPLTSAQGEELRAKVVDAVNDQLIRAGILENEESVLAQREARAIREAMVPFRRVIASFEHRAEESGDDDNAAD
jgi:hypothetical protein